MAKCENGHICDVEPQILKTIFSSSTFKAGENCHMDVVWDYLLPFALILRKIWFLYSLWFKRFGLKLKLLRTKQNIFEVIQNLAFLTEL